MDRVILSLSCQTACKAFAKGPKNELMLRRKEVGNPIEKNFADNKEGFVPGEFWLAATEPLPSCWNDIRQGKQCENVKQKHLA